MRWFRIALSVVWFFGSAMYGAVGLSDEFLGAGPARSVTDLAGNRVGYLPVLGGSFKAWKHPSRSGTIDAESTQDSELVRHRDLLLSDAGGPMQSAIDAVFASGEDFTDGDVVLTLGGSFVERSQRYGWLEAAIQVRFPNRQLKFRNLGWCGDTVFADSRGIFDQPAAGYTRMLAQIRALKPKFILLNYGANESFEGKDGLGMFVSQYERLIEDLASVQARVIMVTPHVHLELPPPLPPAGDRNRSLEVYSGAIQKIAATRNFKLINLMQIDWSKHPVTQLTENGMHLNDIGYRLASRYLSESWIGAPKSVSVSLDSSGNAQAEGASVTDITRTNEGVAFEFQSNELDVFARLRKLKVSGLKDGLYSISVDGEKVGTANSTELANGKAVVLTGPVEIAQSHKLLRKIIEKDTTYFHEWRPQNVTYLFLFRKHEQGNNAKDVDEFKALVEKLDQEIHQLKQPVRQRVEIKAAK